MEQPKYTAGVQTFIKQQRQSMGNWPQTRDVEGRRARYEHYASLFAIPESAPGVAREDVTIECGGHSIAARLYRPNNIYENRVILYFHGGGFVVGGLETHDSVTSFMARHMRATVVSIGYRLAPEFVFPSQLEDAVGALGWARQYFGEDAAIVVAGESAGAGLAALLCKESAEQDLPLRIDGQFLICPGPLSATLEGDEFHDANTDPYLNASDLDYYARAYLGTDASDEKRAFVLDSAWTRVMPPALMYVAMHDPLRLQGLQYANELKQLGSAVCVIEGAGMIHSFIRVCAVDTATADEFASLCAAACDMFYERKELLV